jgi:hypothetical protein
MANSEISLCTRREIMDLARKNIYDRPFFQDGWLWRQMAIHGMLDFRNDFTFVRKMACEIFELGLVPMSETDYNHCKNISMFLHFESDAISSDDFQHILYRFKDSPKRVEMYCKQNKFFSWKSNVFK